MLHICILLISVMGIALIIDTVIIKRYKMRRIEKLVYLKDKLEINSIRFGINRRSKEYNFIEQYATCAICYFKDDSKVSIKRYWKVMTGKVKLDSETEQLFEKIKSDPVLDEISSEIFKEINKYMRQRYWVRDLLIKMYFLLVILLCKIVSFQLDKIKKSTDDMETIKKELEIEERKRHVESELTDSRDVLFREVVAHSSTPKPLFGH